MVLMVFFNSRISPFTSTVILRERSPRATAVVTCAILRTWAVRLAPIAFTEPAFGADFTGHARHFGSERVQLIDHDVDRVLELENLTLHVHRDLARKVA